MATTRSIVITAPGVVGVREGRVGEPGPGLFRVRTTLSLISTGSELAFFEGTHSDIHSGRRGYPAGLGYSNTGVIESVGSEVQGSQTGDRVMCYAGHVSRFSVKPERALVIPEGVADEQAVFAILGSIAVYGLRDASPQFGESAVVLGLGVIGQIAVRLLALTGVTEIIGVDPVAGRREMARRGGATAAAAPHAAEVERLVDERTGGRGAEIVVEASGNPTTVKQAFRIAASRGRIVVLGCPHGEVSLDLYSDFQKKDLRLLGSYQPNCPESESVPAPWTQRRNRALILEYLRRQRLDLAALITHRRPPAEAQGVYEALSRDKGGALAAVFDWRTDEE